MQTATFIRTAHQSTLPGLFLRYVAGHITDTSWAAFMDTLDAADATLQEREAFARFYNDALSDLGSETVRVPGLDELTDLLSAIRLS